MKKKLISLFLCSVLCLCAAGCDGTGNGQVAVSGEDYEYHFYNTHTAATEDYLISCRMGKEMYLTSRVDTTRLEGDFWLSSVNWGFDIGGDTLFFTTEDQKLYSIKLDDVIDKSMAGKSLTEGKKPALEHCSYPKYYDGKLYVSDAAGNISAPYERWKLEEYTTSVYDVTTSPWKLITQEKGIIYPEADLPDLSDAKITFSESHIEYSQSNHIFRSEELLSTFVTNYDDQWIYYTPFSPYLGSTIFRAPYSAEQYDENMDENITDYFPDYSERQSYSIIVPREETSFFLDIIDGWLYYPTKDGGIYSVNCDNLKCNKVLGAP